MFVLIQRITQVFGRVVEFHIERIKNSTIYSVYVNALVDIQACLLEIETESVPHNVTQLLSLERIVQNHTLIRVLPKEFCIKEIGNIQLVQRCGRIKHTRNTLKPLSRDSCTCEKFGYADEHKFNLVEISSGKN